MSGNESTILFWLPASDLSKTVYYDTQVDLSSLRTRVERSWKCGNGRTLCFPVRKNGTVNGEYSFLIFRNGEKHCEKKCEILCVGWVSSGCRIASGFIHLTAKT